MGLINLNENPAVRLADQAKNRIKYLTLMILIWVLFMVFVVIWGEVENSKASEKVTMLEERLRAIGPQVARQQVIYAKIQAQAQWVCGYKTLQAILNHPVQGIYFSLIDYNGKFNLEGRASTQVSLDALKEIMAQYFQETNWEVFPQKNALVFIFKGTPVC